MKLNQQIKTLFTTAALAVGSAQAATINVNITSLSGSSSNPGYGLWGQGTEIWNVTGTASLGSLLDSTGDPSTVGYAISSTTLKDNGWGVDVLTDGGRYASGAGTMTINGLTPNAFYELLTYHPTSHTIESETANSVAPSDFTDATTTTGGATYLDSFDGTGHFWYYSSVTADSGGEILVNFGGASFNTISGFSIRSVPEPSSTALLGLGGLALLLRRRR